VGYAAMGLMLLPMPQYPFLVHLLDVLLHFAVVAVFFWLLQKLGASLGTAFFSALFFSLSPLVVVATGWTGAVFDRLYLLFSLLALVFLHRFVGSERKFHRLVFWLLTSLASALAILSKETAVILPLFLALFALFCQRTLGFKANVRRWIVGLCASFLPWGVYLLLRFSAVQSSLTGSGFGSYDLSLSGIFRNIFVYFVFPFSPSLREVQNFVFLSKLTLAISFIFHILVIFSLFRQKGLSATLWYLIGYFVFLLPVLPIAGLGTQYLYAPALALAMALAFSWGDGPGEKMRKAVVVLGAFALTLHSLVLEKHVYQVGLCQEKILSSAEALGKSLRDEAKKGIFIVPEPGSPDWILRRTFFGRDRFGSLQGMQIRVLGQEAVREDNTVTLVFDKTCSLFLRQP
jgi:4-amino-4-deoxy-L-arabinose transferase-like glycosyltransferase